MNRAIHPSNSIVETTNPPSPRYAHVSHIIKQHLIVLWGGGTGTGRFVDEVHVLDFGTIYHYLIT